MKIVNDKAIIENFAEWGLFEDIFDFTEYSVSKFFKAIKNGEYEVSKEQVKEKLILKEEQDFFQIKKSDLKISYIRLPMYVTGYQKRYSKRLFYFLPVNILTINKSIKELYDLGKWCGLWS